MTPASHERTVRQYAERDIVALDEAGVYYMRHVDALTREQLHAKSDIAAELAFRDMTIDSLREELAAVRKAAYALLQLVRDFDAFLESPAPQGGVWVDMTPTEVLKAWEPIEFYLMELKRAATQAGEGESRG
jgi:hypothetical protein